MKFISTIWLAAPGCDLLYPFNSHGGSEGKMYNKFFNYKSCVFEHILKESGWGLQMFLTCSTFVALKKKWFYSLNQSISTTFAAVWYLEYSNEKN